MFRSNRAEVNHSETPPAKSSWEIVTLVAADPWNDDEEHVIEVTEGPADPTGDPTRVFCAKITKENPLGRVTKDDTTAEHPETRVRLTKPLCDPATCFAQCVCKQTMQSSTQEPSLLRNLGKKHQKKSTQQSICQGLCIFDPSCACGIASARYNKKHPHIQLGAAKAGDSSLSTDLNINIEACTIDKDCNIPWVYVYCDNHTKLYQFFCIKQIEASGKDVTKELEKNYKARRFGKEWMESNYGKNWKDS